MVSAPGSLGGRDSRRRRTASRLISTPGRCPSRGRRRPPAGGPLCPQAVRRELLDLRSPAFAERCSVRLSQRTAPPRPSRSSTPASVWSPAYRPKAVAGGGGRVRPAEVQSGTGDAGDPFRAEPLVSASALAADVSHGDIASVTIAELSSVRDATCANCTQSQLQSTLDCATSRCSLGELVDIARNPSQIAPTSVFAAVARRTLSPLANAPPTTASAASPYGTVNTFTFRATSGCSRPRERDTDARPVRPASDTASAYRPVS